MISGCEIIKIVDRNGEILKKLGIEGDYEGIGHCVIGYPVEIPEAAPRKEGRVYWLTGEE
ncbi:MAG: hypothetical protein IJU00_13935 [Selenomonas sp.]|nr:hypothetical protein [Selenomonas sp.]